MFSYQHLLKLKIGNCGAWAGFFLLVLSCVTSGCKRAPSKSTPKRPNFLIIQVDDLGYDDLALHGNPYLSTPNLDKLGQESVRFDRFYVNAVCAPTRASLLTGQHFLRTGVSHVHGGKDYLSKSIPTLADHFTAAGYICGMWGKWHSGNAEGYYPWQRGFQEAYMSKLYQHSNEQGYLNGQLQGSEQWSDETLVDRALQFMKQNQDTNFLAYLSSMTCHEPLDAPDYAVQYYLDRGLPEGLSTLYGMIHHFDRQVGRLMAGLEDLGLMEHTVILFMSDNGPAVNNGLLSDEGRSLRKINGFKGWKGNLWENGLRSPLFVKWGSAFQSGVQDQVVSVIDVLPTLMDLGGILPPDSISLDGQSFRTLLESQHNGDWENRHIDFVQPGWQPTDAPWTPEGVLNEYAPLGKQKEKIDRSQQPIAVIEKTYKLIRNPGPVDGYENTVPKRVLFDLSSDATEQKNLVDTFPGLAMELDEVANQWFESIKASPFSFQSPEFIIKKDTLSILPLFAPIQTTGDVKVAFRYLHQLKEGSSAAYFIHVEEAGNYNFRFETPNLKGAYQIQTEQGKSALLRDSTVASLTLVKGLQKLEVEVVEAGDSKLRELNILPVSLK